MKLRQAVAKHGIAISRWGLTLALGAALAGTGFAQQQQEQQPPDQPPTQAQPQSPERSAQSAQPQDQQANPQNPNRPPITSQDRVPPTTQQYPDPNQYPDSNPPPHGRPHPRDNRYEQQAPPAPSGPPPDQLTIPAGTVVTMRINEPLSTDHSQVGDQFTGTLQEPIVVNGWVVARRGQTVTGKVKSVKKAGRVKGVSQLGVELTDLTLVDGAQAPILTELWQASAGTSHGADAATIGGTTALGAIIGSAADWGRGAAIGAGAGAVAGIGAVLLTRGRPTVVPPEAQLSFKLVDPVKVDTTHSQHAFLAVTQQDYGYGREGRPHLRAGYGPYGPYPYPAPCGYYYPCYGPGYIGAYPSFGWWGYYGPRHFRRF